MEEIYENHPTIKTKRKNSHWYVFSIISVVLVIAAFVGGVMVGELRSTTDVSTETNVNPIKVFFSHIDQPSTINKKVDFAEFWRVWDMVHERYVRQPVDEMKMYYGAIYGMVASLGDAYSTFLDPEMAKSFKSELDGTFDGIGAEIGVKHGQLTIIAPLPGSPAEQSGLKAGDIILAIDGVDTNGMPADEAVKLIRGTKGSSVKLLINHSGGQPKEVVIVRNSIVVKSVEWRVIQKDSLHYGVIEIHHFNEATKASFEDAVQSLLMENINGLVLDLRNNPGGFLDAAVEVSSEWVSHDVVVQEKFSDGSIKNYTSDGNARLADMPTMVLVNGGTASASEIVAGALQQHSKAKVVGEQTFGKGSVQDYIELDDGSALKLTVALWLTPNGQSIDQQGITPDTVVKLTEADYESDRDPQMDKAVEFLKATRK